MLRYSKVKRSQMQELKKIIAMIESSSLSKFDPRAEPVRTEDNVLMALQELVEVCSLRSGGQN